MKNITCLYCLNDFIYHISGVDEGDANKYITQLRYFSMQNDYGKEQEKWENFRCKKIATTVLCLPKILPLPHAWSIKRIAATFLFLS